MRWAIVLVTLTFLFGVARVSRAAVAPDAKVVKNVVGEGFARKTIYHSPQKPGYTCWVGAWVMPDRSVMVTFKQATGPVEGRPRSTELLKQWGMDASNPQRDFTGLRLANIYLRSTDGGKTWAETAEETFAGPIDRPTWGGSHVALADGAILRAFDGSQAPLVPDLPRRIFFQRSHDLGRTWGAPEIPPEPRRPVEEALGDFGDCITRVRRLRDGRLIATGVKRTRADDRRFGEPVVMLSKDEGKTWDVQRIRPLAEPTRPNQWDEWDCAELPGGDLLCVFRTSDPKRPSKSVRWQGVLRRHGEGDWSLDGYGPAPLEHSGHPELIATREGVVLHLATTGAHWTGDAGATWHPLTVKGVKGPYKTRYYPRSVQLEDGRILVAAHLGWDNPYGEYDQSIDLDTFRLAVE